LHGISFECVSLRELELILELFPAIPGSRVLFTPNFASKREFQAVTPLFVTEERRAALAAVADGAAVSDAELLPFVTVDNSWVLERWGADLFRGRSIFLRVDPGEDGHGHHAHVYTGSGSKFGIEQSVLRSDAFIALVASCGATVQGLHMHKGSGIKDPLQWARSGAALVALLDVFPHVRYIDIGGGIGVPYRPNDAHLDLKALDEALLPVTAATPHVTFCVEPGRFFVAQSGALLARVSQLKTKGRYRFVGLSCGMTHLIRPALYDAYHHIVNLSRLAPVYLRQARDGLASDLNEATHHFVAPADAAAAAGEVGSLVVDIVGPICETGDFLGKARVFPADTDEGDVVCIDNAGAYGRVMASDYNFRTPGPEIVFESFDQ
jgi:diaminopimelate decarboxylase/aspartate kinase